MSRKIIQKSTPTTSAYPAKMNQQVCPSRMLRLGSGLREDKVIYDGLSRKSTYRGAEAVGHDHEEALADERRWEGVCLSTYRPPETLKKSKAMP